jgi:hypothetical protein
MVVIRNRVQVAAILALGAVMVLAILSMAFDASSVVESLFPFVLAAAFGAMWIRQARARVEVSSEGWMATAEGPLRRARRFDGEWVAGWRFEETGWMGWKAICLVGRDGEEHLLEAVYFWRRSAIDKVRNRLRETGYRELP